MLHLLLAASVVLAPTLSPSKAETATPKAEPATCTQAPVRGAVLERTKKGLEATAFVVGLGDVDGGAFALEGRGAMDVVPLAHPEDVRLAHFTVPRGKTLRIEALRPKRKVYKQATIPDDLKEGVLEVDTESHDNLGIELLVSAGPDGSTNLVVAVTAPKGLEQIEIRVNEKAPSKVEDGTRLHGTLAGKKLAVGHAPLKKGLYYLSFDNSNGESPRNRWSGATSGPWTDSGAAFVGGERCDADPPAGAQMKANDGRRRYRRIKKQMISTLQTYTR